MTTAEEGRFTIGEVSKIAGLSTHAIRFYEDEGLFTDPVERDDAGRRRFTTEQVAWLMTSKKLRAANMPIHEIRTYAEAGRAAAGGREARLQLLREHQKRVKGQLAALEDVLDSLSASDKPEAPPGSWNQERES